jgi:hypothetical protein
LKVPDISTSQTGADSIAHTFEASSYERTLVVGREFGSERSYIPFFLVTLVGQVGAFHSVTGLVYHYQANFSWFPEIGDGEEQVVENTT